MAAERVHLRNPRLAVRLWLIVLVAMDAAIFALAVPIWGTVSDRPSSWPSNTMLIVWGISAGLGASTALIALGATLRRVGHWSPGPGETAWILAWFKLIALPVAFLLIATMGGPTDFYKSTYMMIEATGCILVISVARRHWR